MTGDIQVRYTKNPLLRATGKNLMFSQRNNPYCDSLENSDANIMKNSIFQLDNQFFNYNCNDKQNYQLNNHEKHTWS